MKNKTFKVSVTKAQYCNGAVEVKAQNPDHAVRKVRQMIDKGQLQTPAVEWDDPIYEDSSFDTTGDVE